MRKKSSDINFKDKFGLTLSRPSPKEEGAYLFPLGGNKKGGKKIITIKLPT